MSWFMKIQFFLKAYPPLGLYFRIFSERWNFHLDPKGIWVLKKKLVGGAFPGGPVIKTCTAKREDLISDQGTKVPKKRKKKDRGRCQIKSWPKRCANKDVGTLTCSFPGWRLFRIDHGNTNTGALPLTVQASARCHGSLLIFLCRPFVTNVFLPWYNVD